MCSDEWLAKIGEAFAFHGRERLSCAGLGKRLPFSISVSQISDVFSGCQGENVKDLFRKWLE